MNFFRMRILNTFLVLLIGILLGYIAKDRSGMRTAASYAGKRQSSVQVIAASEPDAAELSALKDRPAGSGTSPAGPADRTDGEEFELPVKLPAATEGADHSYKEEDNPSMADTDIPDEAPVPKGEKAGGVLRGAEEEFFRNPGRFSGETLEFELQMLTAVKRQKGWLINLAHIKSGKSADYLYVEDESVLGERPDLKIGFFYKIIFRCRKGDPAAGNTLLNLVATGNKAVWATGISAIE